VGLVWTFYTDDNEGTSVAQELSTPRSRTHQDVSGLDAIADFGHVSPRLHGCNLSMKNPFRSTRPQAPRSSPSESPIAPPSRWPAFRGILLGTILLSTSAFLAIDLWTWRQASNRQTEALRQAQRAADALGRRARALREDRDQGRTALERSQTELTGLGTRLKDLEQKHRQASEAQQRLENEMRAALQSRDVTISRLAGKLTVNILDRVLFASGEAEIKEEGQQVLRQVALILDQFPDRQIQVIGHTDNVPISTPRYPSNWELSAARALAAVRFLAEEAGVHPARLGALAHSEFHPIADNSGPDGRAQNRRIAIVVLPEIVTSETTNAPPTESDTTQSPSPQQPAHEDAAPSPVPAASGTRSSTGDSARLSEEHQDPGSLVRH